MSDQWQTRAACRDTDMPELWFPVSGNAQQQITDAKAVCRRCPVLAPCLETALAASWIEGVWGNTTPDERRQIRRRRGRAREQEAS